MRGWPGRASRIVVVGGVVDVVGGGGVGLRLLILLLLRLLRLDVVGVDVVGVDAAAVAAAVAV